MSIYLKNIMPILEIVAGEAHDKSWVSNKKLTLGPNWIRSPDGIVSNLLSSSTEFKDSIHSGSISPSHMTQEWTSVDSRTTWRALEVSTPSVHSLVSISICPSSYPMRYRCIKWMYLTWVSYVPEFLAWLWDSLYSLWLFVQVCWEQI